VQSYLFLHLVAFYCCLEPIEELELMTANRSSRRKDGGTGLKQKDLCNGPSKLCAALAITKAEFNQQHIASCSTLWLEGR
jgi:DNA-3-methyladenine glycosylase